MKTVIISGSHRKNSQSIKVAHFIEQRLQKMGAETSIINLAENSLPLWDEGVWSGEEKWKKAWNPLADQLKSADSLVVITPEYAGMAAPALKNFFLFCGGDLIAHKPAMLVAVSSGMGGSYPIQEMRGSSYKNCRILYVPDHVIIKHAETLLLTEVAEPDSVDDQVRKKIDYSLLMLQEYSKAMGAVRTSKVLDYKNFPFGA